MKVVCINRPQSPISLFGRDIFISAFKFGNVYDVKNIESDDVIVEPAIKYYRLISKDELGNSGYMVTQSFFITLKEYRKQKLKKIEQL